MSKKEMRKRIEMLEQLNESRLQCIINLENQIRTMQALERAGSQPQVQPGTGTGVSPWWGIEPLTITGGTNGGKWTVTGAYHAGEC